MTPPEPARHGDRFDALDGLRTVAVFLVIAFHVSVPRMSAGFLGVDMFFVLSGFFITQGLIRDVQNHGRVRLARFWSRRMRRLLPAALLVVCAVLAWAWWFADLYRHDDLGKDAWYTIIYLANWRFIDSTSYFASDGTVSPLLHMWSLAVEEQFYLVWPLLITGVLLVLRWGRSRTVRSSRTLRVLAVVALVVIVASVLRMYQVHSGVSADRAYMGTDAKAFEPMLGALAAILLTDTRLTRCATRWSRPLIWAGGIAMVMLFAVLDGPSSRYFTGGALLFSLATTAVLVGVRYGLSSWEARILAWTPISYLGRISYGLYLWHWPWAVWLLDPEQGFQPMRAGAVLALTVTCAALSYHLVEMPIRSGSFAAGLGDRRIIASGLAAMAATTLVASCVGGAPLSRYLVPLLHGNSDRSTILLVGDSVPKRLSPALAEVADEQGYDVISAARGSCSPMGVRLDHAKGEACTQVPAVQDELIRQYDPEIVLWWSRYDSVERFSDTGTLLRPESEDFWTEQAAEFDADVDRLSAQGATVVVVLTERPGLGMLTRSESALQTPLIQNMIHHDEHRRRFNDLVRQRAADRDDLTTVDGDSLFCPPGPPAGPGSLCDDTGSAGTYIRYDGSHVDVEVYGREVSDDLLTAMEESLGR